MGTGVVVVPPELPPLLGGRTPVEKRMMRMITRMTVMATHTSRIVIFVFFHHILRDTLRAVFLKVAD